MGLLLVGAMIFLPAGTLHYPSGWLFMAVLFVPMFIAGMVMLLRSPKLLKKRLNAKRIRNEGEVLCKGLTGYYDYCRKVRYMIIPFVW